MSRGVALSVIRGYVNAECGFASQTTNTARDAMVNTLIANKQRWLATEYDWPFLASHYDLNAPANTQYLTLPTQTGQPNVATIALNLERMPTVEVFWNTVYRDVEYGIGEMQYNSMNYALGQQSDPIQRWRWASNADDPTPNQIEVWPVPVTASVLRFTGQRSLLPLLVDADKADLDEMLLTYAVAAELLTRAKQADAQLKLTQFQRRLAWCRQMYPTEDKRMCLGQGDRSFKESRRLTGMIVITH